MSAYKWGNDPEFFGPQMYYRTSLMLDKLRAHLKKGRVLDAGCGDGVLSFRLARAGFIVVAADAAKKCISYMERKIKRLHLQAFMSAQLADLANLSYKAKTFDAVTCGEVLEHIADDTRVIRQFFRVLKPGGICIITTPGKPHMWHEIDDISGHVRRYTTGELRQKFESAGFTVLGCWYWGFPINSLWHRLVFKPFILRKMQSKNTVTSSRGLVAHVVKSAYLQRMCSLVFDVDRLFDWTGLGEFIALVAQKKP